MLIRIHGYICIFIYKIMEYLHEISGNESHISPIYKAIIFRKFNSKIENIMKNTFNWNINM